MRVGILNQKAGNKQIGQEWAIAMAFVGVIVGAGLSSGQDILQYFLSFGSWGLAGIILLTGLMVYFGGIILAFGSHYRASSHETVLKKIGTPLTSRVIDWMLVAASFIIGFVMIAGAGSNLEQQFGLPSWAGALLCTVLVVAASFLDFDKITRLLGIFTPLVIVMLIGICAYSLLTRPLDIDALDAAAKTISAPVGNVWLSALNYFAMCIMTGLSMAIVLGGSTLEISTAEKGGRYGGLMIGLIMVLAFVSLFLNIDMVKDAPIPMLKIASEISPLFALVYTLTILALIFNTAFSLFYALAKRFGKGEEKRTRLFMIVLCAAGYGCSFGGFTEMIGTLYPLIGWMGLLPTGLLATGWLKQKDSIQSEKKTRSSLLSLARNWKQNEKKLSIKERKTFDALCLKSCLSTPKIRQAVLEEVLQ